MRKIGILFYTVVCILILCMAASTALAESIGRTYQVGDGQTQTVRIDQDVADAYNGGAGVMNAKVQLLVGDRYGDTPGLSDHAFDVRVVIGWEDGSLELIATHGDYLELGNDHPYYEIGVHAVGSTGTGFTAQGNDFPDNSPAYWDLADASDCAVVFPEDAVNIQSYVVDTGVTGSETDGWYHFFIGKSSDARFFQVAVQNDNKSATNRVRLCREDGNSIWNDTVKNNGKRIFTIDSAVEAIRLKTDKGRAVYSVEEVSKKDYDDYTKPGAKPPSAPSGTGGGNAYAVRDDVVHPPFDLNNAGFTPFCNACNAQKFKKDADGKWVCDNCGQEWYGSRITRY